MTLTLFKNGKLTSAGRPGDDAVLVEDGFIKAVGKGSELSLQLPESGAAVIDWDGGHVLPGLVDAHVHLGMHGMKLDMLDFTGMTSKEEMLQAIRERAALTPPGEWILGLNWNENEFRPAAAPHISELDAVTLQHPVFLTRTCFHAFLGNSEAFRRAGVTASTPDFASGAYGRDGEGGLNGWIYEDAVQPFNEVQPAPDYTALKQAVRRGIADALSLGLTAVHTEDLRLLGSVETMLRIHRELREEGVLFRTHQLLYYAYLQEVEQLGLAAGSGDEWLRLGAVKLFADGAIGGRTALLEQPYSDEPGTSGIAIHTQEGLDEIVRAARRLGYPVAVHAIGDAAARMTLAAMQHKPLRPDAALPDRFIHAQVLNRSLVEQMASMRLIADIQPRFVASDFPWVLERVGPARAGYLYAWKKLLAAGIPCAGGSDAPIEPLSPFLGMHAAVTRCRPGERHEGYLPEEKLSPAEALRLFTEGSAVAAGEQQERGRITPGCRADFTVIDRDIMADAEEMLNVKVRMTVINGIAAYNAD
ncbi:amidohydrolase [Paenibacillus sp. FSL R7-0331]|uniref:amidohydrolase n=1 Tax=Paenibacillus sp. FSL R7-0331 TaxID=1536773 RepID=UPI0004F58A2A|nr:amidohydrolase [Paenibacillus sp. FSL R7-0331]AIQ51777.1 hydrolase [Paenibacillus sp. FSL R7-0331]